MAYDDDIPDDPAACIQLAKKEVAKRKTFFSSGPDYERAAELYSNAGKKYERQNAHSDAASASDAAASIYFDNRMVMTDALDAGLRAAKAYRQIGRPNDAARNFKRLVDWYEKNPDSYASNRTQTFVTYADFLEHDAQNIEEAFATLEKLAVIEEKKQPLTAQKTWTKLGEAAARVGDLQRAFAVFLKITDFYLTPGDGSDTRKYSAAEPAKRAAICALEMQDPNLFYKFLADYGPKPQPEGEVLAVPGPKTVLNAIFVQFLQDVYTTVQDSARSKAELNEARAAFNSKMFRLNQRYHLGEWDIQTLSVIRDRMGNGIILDEPAQGASMLEPEESWS